MLARLENVATTEMRALHLWWRTRQTYFGFTLEQFTFPCKKVETKLCTTLCTGVIPPWGIWNWGQMKEQSELRPKVSLEKTKECNQNLVGRTRE